ncbi:conserved hypothetical protein [Turicibacter sanguinis PC909]|uniref:Thoeris protein ThsA Macro domain-containing protein n=1 Tax=Turicibacter sanguinis PC909 TaxID=702450 RepID=A0ABP2HY38_9FIRM|nr:macro domain-containing protein [Turicibacter sanguinis]EFF62517.1 conserved hypothetical protein [Turicibacter sanguinis PC909]
MRIKVNFFDKKIINQWLAILGIFGGIYTYITIFIPVPEQIKNNKGSIILAIIISTLLIAIYIFLWIKANLSTKVTLNINNSILEVKTGNIFRQKNFKVIPFNEYFDTLVDDDLISKTSLNGIFIENELDIDVQLLDNHIEKQLISRYLETEETKNRNKGKKVKYPLGTICKYDDYLLTAFSKFDSDNKAYLTMQNYINFLMKFWDEIDRVYAGKSIAIPVLGSGITRFKENINITDQELLEILIWSFKISRIKIKYPSKVSIIIYDENVDKIDFYKLKELK